MNTGPIVSQIVGEDLSAAANSHIGVKLVSTGIKACGILDLLVGTLIRGNAAPANGQTIPTNFTPACDVFLTRSNGLHFVKLGANSAAIAMGDELVSDASGTFLNKPTLASLTSTITGVFSTGVITSASPHGLSAGQRIRLISQTGAVGLSAGQLFYVRTVPSTTTFTLSPTKGGPILGTSADVTYWTSTDISAMVIQSVGQEGGVILAWDSAPVTSTGGIIRALFV